MGTKLRQDTISGGEIPELCEIRPHETSSHQEFKFKASNHPKLTHNLFRYPAKFHPPIAGSLVEQFSQPGDWILDPFCGSGTILVEATARGRNAIGMDWDPIAVFVSRMKTHKFDIEKLRGNSHQLLEELGNLERPTDEYKCRTKKDLTKEEYLNQLQAGSLWVPQIPNLHHWFRNYVIVDMAKILKTILDMNIPATHKDFLKLCFSKIIRACSNADPVPISGLEVTSIMKKKEQEGRLINPFENFRQAIRGSLEATANFASAKVPGTKVTTIRCDATKCSTRTRRVADCIITSPPYFTAVDYYRRHQLEMYWLGFTKTHDERKKLIPNYIGRTNVSARHPILKETANLGPLGRELLARLEGECKERLNAFNHYVISMTKVFHELPQVVTPEGKVVIVIGNNVVNGSEMPTADLIVELCGTNFELIDRKWYHLKDRYMSYKRNHGANIDTEHVLVFQKR